jgi:hypothetical protein
MKEHIVKSGKQTGKVYDMNEECVGGKQSLPLAPDTTVVRVFVVQQFRNVNWYEVEVPANSKDPIALGRKLADKVATKQAEEGDPKWSREKATDNHPHSDEGSIVTHVGSNFACKEGLCESCKETS